MLWQVQKYLHPYTTDHFGDAGSPAIALRRMLPRGDCGARAGKTDQIKVSDRVGRQQAMQDETQNNRRAGTGAGRYLPRASASGLREHGVFRKIYLPIRVFRSVWRVGVSRRYIYQFRLDGIPHTTIVQGHAQEPISNSSAKSRHACLVLRRGTTVESRVSYVPQSPDGSIL
jgi:hypothetical protein